MREQNYHNIFSRRMMMLGVGKICLLGTVVGRYFDLQINEREKYRTLSDMNKFTLQLKIPDRGKIIDRNNMLLADNSKRFQVSIIPEKAGSVEATLQALAKIHPISDGEMQAIRERIQQAARFNSVILLNDINRDAFNKIMVNYHNLSGLEVSEVPLRVYPLAEKAAHLTGYVGEPSKEDTIAVNLRNKRLANNQRFVIGKQALEKFSNSLLSGVPGIEKLEINAYGRTVSADILNAGVSGRDIRITVDGNLQSHVYDLLQEQTAGSAVVMDVLSGEILSMVSVPSYDCNQLVSGVSEEQWQELVGDNLAPLNDRSCRSAYPPGSTFKPIVALAALRHGIPQSHKTFCNGKIKVGDSTLHCWKRGGHGSMDMKGALRESCDVWFYRVAEKLGMDKIAEEARRFGLGRTHSLPLGRLASGLIGTPAWKRKTHNDNWYLGDTMIAAIGQGYMLASPLQLALMTAKIASGNVALQPQLMMTGIARSAQEYDLPQNLNIVREGLWQVVNARIGGTAYKSRIQDKTFQMAGKTGTSQVHRLSAAEREALRQGGKKFVKPWNLRDHALFVGYAPYDTPRYAVAVIVEHGESGSGTAAPIVKNIMEYLRQNTA